MRPGRARLPPRRSEAVHCLLKAQGSDVLRCHPAARISRAATRPGTGQRAGAAATVTSLGSPRRSITSPTVLMPIMALPYPDPRRRAEDDLEPGPASCWAQMIAKPSFGQNVRQRAGCAPGR
jgi:hypothetical protein